MTNHAILSPSGFKALMLCPAKPAMERGLPDKSSEHADEGTLAHEVAAIALCNEYERPTECEPDMAQYVQVYIDTVRDYQGPDGELFVEQAVPIGHITGEGGAEGTADAIILRGDEITVVDLKYGKGVEVEADHNPQLMLYALGALEKFSLLGDFKRVRMVIVQPRVSSAPSEMVMTVDELRHWADNEATPAAKAAWAILDYANPLLVSANCHPHEDACRFCKAKAACPALSNSVEKALGAEFTDLTTADQVEKEQIVKGLTGGLSVDQLGAKMDAVELIEMWCKAIRGRTESELLAGKPVAGYKLVQGKRGARAWADTQAAEKMLKSFRLKNSEMYDFTVISPTTAEKKLGKQVKRWEKLQPLITQSEGKPSVAPISDKRPALEIKPVSEEFSVIEGADDLV